MTFYFTYTRNAPVKLAYTQKFNTRIENTNELDTYTKLGKNTFWSTKTAIY